MSDSIPLPIPFINASIGSFCTAQGDSIKLEHLYILSDMLGRNEMSRGPDVGASELTCRDSGDDAVTAARVVKSNIVTLTDWSRWS